jgi:EAL domain-containing protein (putative c-di-GMP-specific phosphodiesterase class I)
MATELGVSLTAEGIETEGQLRMVEAFGIARAQGYLLGQPGQYAADDAGLPMRVAAQ